MARIYIDPGHGGSDPGTSWGGLLEKDIVLTAGLACRDVLLSAGHEVRMSRTGDTGTTVSGIVGGNNGWADYHVSIHVNAGGGVGSEAWVHYDLSATTGDELANAILSELSAVGFKTDRGIRTKRNSNGEDYYFNIRETDCPAVLVEIGFIDCPQDAELMNTIEKQKKIGQAISNGIVKFVGGAKPVKPKNNLDVDGIIGLESVKALQRFYGMSDVDGVLSGQFSAMREYLPSVIAIEWTTRPGNGSPTVRAMQRGLNCTVDGLCGPETVKALQRFLCVAVDGILGPTTAKALQRFLNLK